MTLDTPIRPEDGGVATSEIGTRVRRVGESAIGISDDFYGQLHFYARIVRAMPRLGELLGHTRALGVRHAGYGVRAADYRTVGDALLAALAVVLGDSFDAPTREAWDIAYNLVAETMLEGAAAARPIGNR